MTADADVSRPRRPVSVITWKSYAATKAEVCAMLDIPVPHRAEVDLEVTDLGIRVMVKASETLG